MGTSPSEEKKSEEITAEYLNKLMLHAEKSCYDKRKEVKIYINYNKNLFTKKLINNDLNGAKQSIDKILRYENIFKINTLIESAFEKLKGKGDLILSSKECPEELKVPINTVLYGKFGAKNKELFKFEFKIGNLYGYDYVDKAENNTDRILNEDLIKKLKPIKITEELRKNKFKQICKEKNLRYSFNSDSNKVIVNITSEVNEFFCKTKVTQKFSNPLDNPMELKIYVFKKENIIFSSFDCQIGDSIKVKSKVIKKEKAQEKYVDSISSGNASIFVTYDPFDKNMIIINMGNLPPKSNIIFNSYFISPIVSSYNKYEFELFRNFPIFTGKDDEIYLNTELNGEIIIKSKYEIKNIKKNILMKDLIISKEKLSSKNPYTYNLKFKIDNLPSFRWYDLDYIPSSKFYYDLNINQPLALAQESNNKLIQKFYYIQYLFKLDQLKKENRQEMTPSLFIFLIDQSGSMYGSSIEIASKALILFLQSIPVGSYYQIIGFGDTFVKYDETPKEYNKENIKKSINIIQNLDADLGGTNIYAPLKNIFDSKDYNKINLSRNVFLLTDGQVADENKVLNLIEANNSKFKIYSIGIGNDFDEDLIKNAGIIGKGNYNFCKDIDKLNSVIASEINFCSNPFITDIKFNCNLDNKNIITNNIKNILNVNGIINLYYAVNDKNIEKKIQLNIEFKDNKGFKYKKNYEIVPEILEIGNDLSKLIIYNYILNNNNLSEEEKIKLALKHQIFMEGTSLFAEIELSEKNSSEMKLKIIGDKKQNLILNKKEEIVDDLYIEPKSYFEDILDVNSYMKDSFEDNKIILPVDYGKIKNNINRSREEKDEFMEMINTQDFIEGYWEQNDKTQKIIEIYEKEYKLIKELKNKNIDEKTAITILIIYSINKDYNDLLNDLIMVIKKAKIFIQKVTNDSYENIIKEVNFS